MPEQSRSSARWKFFTVATAASRGQEGNRGKRSTQRGKKKGQALWGMCDQQRESANGTTLLIFLYLGVLTAPSGLLRGTFPIPLGVSLSSESRVRSHRSAFHREVTESGSEQDVLLSLLQLDYRLGRTHVEGWQLESERTACPLRQSGESGPSTEGLCCLHWQGWGSFMSQKVKTFFHCLVLDI